MKLYFIAALTALMFTAGILAGATEKHVAQSIGAEPIAEALATDNIATGVCQGGSTPMCYPPECGGNGDSCPVNNQCIGGKFCYLHEESQASGITISECETSGLCDSSRDAEDGFLIEDRAYAAVSLPSELSRSTPTPTGKQEPAHQRMYTSYY